MLTPSVAQVGTADHVRGAQIFALLLCDEPNRVVPDRDVVPDTVRAVHVITMADLAESLGGGLLSVVIGPKTSTVDDVTIAEPGPHLPARPGDLVLGVGLQDVSQAVELIRQSSDSRAAGVALRRSLTRRRRVHEAAEAMGLCVVAVGEQASWAHLAWLLRGAIDRAAAQDLNSIDGPVHDDLFVLADAVATLVGGPVTIEDSRSRVLAYSARQDVTDEARVSTIIGRRVPPALLAAYRAGGVFRRLATSADPFMVPPSSGGEATARYVVPVRAGGEWLGSMWVVIDAPPPNDVVEELVSTAAVLALHLLRLRSRSDLSQRVVRERLRQALARADNDARRWLPKPPWRVVALGPGTGLELWESLLRRRSWAQPLVVDIDGRDYALVSDGGGTDTPGTWAWLESLVQTLGRAGDPVLAAAGRPTRRSKDLPRSRSEALEALMVLERGNTASGATTVERVWAQVTIDRAAHALEAEPPLGPLKTLRRHDEEQGSDYLHTLAAYLDHPAAPGAAAAAIHVHPNTLRYRMQRISELADIDLLDADVRLALQLQLRLRPAVRPLARDGIDCDG